MNVAGMSAMRLSVVSGIAVCGQNIRSITAAATAIEATASISSVRRSRCRRTSSGSSSSGEVTAVSGRTS